MDNLTPAERSERMKRIRDLDTTPDMRVRRQLHRMGYRYRLHRRDLPGTPDMVFASRYKAIWVHGCFWHRHPDPRCKLARLPKSRPEFWVPKLEGNRARDLKKQEELLSRGWTFLVVWECEIRKERALVAKMREFLGEPGEGR